MHFLNQEIMKDSNENHKVIVNTFMKTSHMKIINIFCTIKRKKGMKVNTKRVNGLKS